MNILSSWLRSYLARTHRLRPSTGRRSNASRNRRRRRFRDCRLSEYSRRFAIRDGHHDQPRRCDEPLRHSARGGHDLRPDTGAARYDAARRKTRQRPSRPIEAPEACGRFTARILRDVKIGPSHRHRRGALRCPRPKAHPQCRRRQQLRPARHGPAHACLRSRQDRRRHHRPPRAQGRKAQDSRRHRPHARRRRPRCRRREEGPRPRRRHGRLGHHDHARDQEHPRRSRVVRSRHRAPHEPPPRAFTPTPRTASSAARTSTRRPSPPRSSRSSSSRPAAISKASSSMSSSRKFWRASRPGGPSPFLSRVARICSAAPTMAPASPMKSPPPSCARLAARSRRRPKAATPSRSPAGVSISNARST